MIKISIFIVLTLSFFIFTMIRSHPYRYFRFFAFECLFILILLNSDFWFLNPFSIIQILSWMFLASSFYLAIEGFRLLKYKGLPASDIEDTSELIETGIYRYIRHPLYCSIILAGVGALLKNLSFYGLIFLTLLIWLVYKTGKVEEISNLNKFGESYQNYINKTKMFIPFFV